MVLEIAGIMVDSEEPQEIIKANGITLELNRADTELMTQYKGEPYVCYNVIYNRPEPEQ